MSRPNRCDVPDTRFWRHVWPLVVVLLIAGGEGVTWYWALLMLPIGWGVWQLAYW